MTWLRSRQSDRRLPNVTVNALSSVPRVPVWPNLFVVGAPKAGTTSLHALLAGHPDIFMSGLKEPHYFSSVSELPAWRGQSGAVTSSSGRLMAPTVSSEAAYIGLFRKAGQRRVVGESSTSYLSDPATPSKIAEASPNARIIVMIRDPVARAASHHLMFAREGWEERSLERAVLDEIERVPSSWAYSYLRNGLYHADLSRYLKEFGDRVLVLVLEEFARDLQHGMEAVCRFLDVSPREVRETRPHNAHTAPRNRFVAAAMQHDIAWTFGRRVLPGPIRHRVRDATLRPADKPPLDEDLRRLLVAYYRDDAQATERFIGRPLPWRLCRE